MCHRICLYGTDPHRILRMVIAIFSYSIEWAGVNCFHSSKFNTQYIDTVNICLSTVTLLPYGNRSTMADLFLSACSQRENKINELNCENNTPYTGNRCAYTVKYSRTERYVDGQHTHIPSLLISFKRAR